MRGARHLGGNGGERFALEIGVVAIASDVALVFGPEAVVALADRDLRRHPKGAAQPGMLRSSLIGTWIGILPGVGAQIGSVVAYGAERQFSKTPDKFGTGCEEGVVASEAANNATIGGALIPLIAMGIPGSVIDAILIGALMIHQLQPGPLLFTTHPHIAHAIMGAMLISTVLSYVMLTGAVKGIAQLMYLRRAYLFPVIIVFCVIGTYALNNRVFDVWVMLGFGVIGYCLERCRVPLGPFVIGLVLAPIPRSNCARD